MEEAISSAGRWTWVELANDSIQLEFEDVQLYKPSLEKYDKHSSEIAIRLADNAFFTLFYNKDNDINFDIDFLENLNDFSYKVSNEGLRFQNFDFFKKIVNSYNHRKILAGKSFEDNYEIEVDFLLCIAFEDIAIACGANQLNFFNDFEALNDEDIKRLSNQWWVYWMDYWKAKEADNRYEHDPACEAIPSIDSIISVNHEI